MNADNTELLRNIFYDARRGFKSQAALLREARFDGARISKDEVRAFLRDQDVRQIKTTPARYNSFVPVRPRQQFQVDLMDFGTRAEVRYALVAVDIFTKKIGAAILRDKSSRLTALALREIIVQLGMPASIMTDLGGEFQADFAQQAKFLDIPLIFNRSPPRFVERAIGTLRKMILDRALALRQPWHRLLPPVVEAYNETEHSATGVMPDIAAEEFPEVTDEIRERLQRKAKPAQTKREPLNPGDVVKLFVKKGKYSEFKTGFRQWGEKPEIVEKAELLPNGQTVYRIEGLEHPVLRHNLLRVRAVEDAPDEVRLRGAQAVSEPRYARMGRILE